MSIRKLKQVHSATHPGATLKRRNAADGCDATIPSLAAVSDENSNRAQTLEAMLASEALAEEIEG